MEQENNITELIAQRRLLKTIIGKGTKFTVKYTVKVRQKGLRGFFGRKTNEVRKEDFILQEPTLAVLDRASEVWLRMDTESLGKEGADETREGFKAANKNSRDMAECLAILVLGEAYYAVEGGDNEELERLTKLFYRTIKPSQTHDIATFINAASNLVDFTDSMRLMKTAVTTTPAKRIESVE